MTDKESKQEPWTTFLAMMGYDPAHATIQARRVAERACEIFAEKEDSLKEYQSLTRLLIRRIEELESQKQDLTKQLTQDTPE